MCDVLVCAARYLTALGLADALVVDILGLFSSPLVVQNRNLVGSRSLSEAELGVTSLSEIAVEAELGVINDAIAASERTVRFKAVFATPDSISLCASRRPKVIHFGGHGFPGGICLEDACGKCVETTDVRAGTAARHSAHAISVVGCWSRAVGV